MENEVKKDNIHKFQGLFEELFQFDAADLDFGIYRIMNYKRGVIERFITEDLPKSISQELAQGALNNQSLTPFFLYRWFTGRQ
jgi:adenine-specific DNA-methyltransferase